MPVANETSQNQAPALGAETPAPQQELQNQPQDQNPAPQNQTPQLAARTLEQTQQYFLKFMEFLKKDSKLETAKFPFPINEEGLLAVAAMLKENKTLKSVEINSSVALSDKVKDAFKAALKINSSVSIKISFAQSAEVIDSQFFRENTNSGQTLREFLVDQDKNIRSLQSTIGRSLLGIAGASRGIHDSIAGIMHGYEENLRGVEKVKKGLEALNTKLDPIAGPLKKATFFGLSTPKGSETDKLTEEFLKDADKANAQSATSPKARL